MRIHDMLMANKIRDGDVQAFEALVQRQKVRVFNYCLRICSNYHLAEELTQEVFFKVYQNLECYDWRKASLANEIREITNLPVGTIKSRLHSIRIKLRILVGDINDK